VKPQSKSNIVGLALGLATMLTLGGAGSFAAENASGSSSSDTNASSYPYPDWPAIKKTAKPSPQKGAEESPSEATKAGPTVLEKAGRALETITGGSTSMKEPSQGGTAPQSAIKETASEAAVARTRQEVKLLDDLLKNMIVIIDAHYVRKPGDFAAATAAKALFSTMKKNGWCDVRLLGLTDVIGDPDDVPRDAFEQTAAKKLLAGDASYEEIMEKDGKRYLRVATGVPVVSPNCVMCHTNFEGNKGNIGALSYTMPMLEY
jgi:Protein of unknown function (DUF3365)